MLATKSMAKVQVIIVPSCPANEAEAAFREWGRLHAHLVSRLRPDDVEVTHIRGPGEDGRIIEKRRYSVMLDESDAERLGFPLQR
ncbi:MAG TPA: hypothetical protein VGI39_37635 [Polyangiaceae bacterium]|jgi:hypothetical protein